MAQVPVKLDANDEIAQYPAGFRWRDEDTGQEFIYVQFDDGAAVTAVAGYPVGWLASVPKGKVTTDFSGSSVNQIAGILQAVLTDQYFGWIEDKGKGAKGLTLASGTSSDGNKLVWAGDGTVAVMTDPGNEEAVFATTTAGSTLTAIAAGDYYLHIPGA